MKQKKRLLYSEDLKSIRLAPAYDIVSTVIYESSTENMALSIDGIYNINEITRESFEKETVRIGIGTKMAMSRLSKYMHRLWKKGELGEVIKGRVYVFATA